MFFLEKVAVLVILIVIIFRTLIFIFKVCTPSYYFKTIQEDATVNTVLVDLTGVCTDSETATAALAYSITSGMSCLHTEQGEIVNIIAF